MDKLAVFIFITILPVLVAVDIGRLKLASVLFFIVMAPVLLYLIVYPIPYVSELQVLLSVLALAWLVKERVFSNESQSQTAFSAEQTHFFGESSANQSSTRALN